MAHILTFPVVIGWIAGLLCRWNVDGSVNNYYIMGKVLDGIGKMPYVLGLLVIWPKRLVSSESDRVTASFSADEIYPVCQHYLFFLLKKIV